MHGWLGGGVVTVAVNGIPVTSTVAYIFTFELFSHR